MMQMRKALFRLFCLVIAGLAITVPPPLQARADTTPARPPVAQSTGNDVSAPSGPASNGSAPSGQSGCPGQNPLPAADAHAALQILPSTRWQPYGGDVQFELTGVGAPLSQISVSFAWPSTSAAKPPVCLASPRVRLLPMLENDDAGTYRYAARLPALDNDTWISGWGHWNWPSTVPLADMYVDGLGASGATQVVFISAVGISTPWMDFVGALALAIFVWAALACWARKRKIPGGPFLAIISTPNGVASLSQFQILIWTYVIGIGVVYVMMISGNLIDIPASTLSLLGITGFALVGSKLRANADGTPKRQSAPGAVTALDVLGNPGQDMVVLTWTAPAGADQPLSYTIQYRNANFGMWISAAHGIAAPPFAVTGLMPNTNYDFQVFAVNAGGTGPASVPKSAWTAIASPVAGPAPLQVTGVHAEAQEDGTVKLSWANPAPLPDSFIIQYRPVGELAWSTHKSNASPPTFVDGLRRGTSYQFQVYANSGGRLSSPSDLAEAATTSRQPQWSDLIMSGDDNAEVDLSRLQMLIFTTITAVFTAITLINTGVIPDLPVGELALVGISNGVYLASKVSTGGNR